MGPNIEELKQYELKKKKAQKLADIQARAVKIAAANEPPKPEVEVVVEEKPKMVTLDDAGRMRDEQGNILNIKVIH